MTMTNAEWCIKNNIKFQEIHIPYDAKAKEAKIIYRNKEIGRSKFCDTPFTTLKVWLDMEHVEPILDEAEKKYLSAVIRPFRDRVKRICKVNYLGVSSSEYQRIYITLSDNSHDIDLPLFKKETMYKGMELGKKYTPEELGL